MLRVGIHENVKLGTEHSITEFGTLQVHLIQGEGVDMFTSLIDNNSVVAEEAKLFVPGFFLNQYDSDDPKPASTLVKEVRNIRSYMADILKIYLTTDKVDEYLDSKTIMANLGMTTKEEVEKTLPSKSILDAIYEKYAKGFMQACKDEKLAEADKLFRIKLVRQSKEKHFPSFTKYTFSPWIESMDIPKESSKIVFTAQEIEKGLNSASIAPSDPVSTVEVNTAEQLHGTNGSGEKSFPSEEMLNEGNLTVD